jgi:gag-polyprotein putative aspartyl protease
MPRFGKMTVPVVGCALLACVLVIVGQARGQSSPPPVVGEEIQRARSDFAAGGARRLSVNWNTCVNRARASQDANAAEHCVVYGYGALFMADATADGSGPLYLTADIVAPGQIEMLDIMGIPEGPRQAWLERYRRWVSAGLTPGRGYASDEGYSPERGNAPARGSTPEGDYAPNGNYAPARGGHPDRGYGSGRVSSDRGYVSDRGGNPDNSGFTSDGGLTPVRGFAPERLFTPDRSASSDGGLAPDRGASSERGFTLGRGNDPDRVTSDGSVAPDRSITPDRSIAPDRGVVTGRASMPVRSFAPARDIAPIGVYVPARGNLPTSGISQDSVVTPVGGIVPVGGFTPSFGPGGSGAEGGNPGVRTDFIKAVNGQYPRDVLRQPEIAAVLRRLIGPVVFSHLTDYNFGRPMESHGQYAVGTACVARDCGGAEVRYVFSPDDVWVGIIDGRRMRIYGNPPRQARTVLLRDRNQVPGRNTIEDMPRPTQSAALSPVVIPVSTQAAIPHAPPENDTTEIRLRRQGGTFDVPVTINDTMTLPFAIDSGSSDVSVSADVMRKLIQSESVSKADFLGKQTYHLADGSMVSSDTFRIHSLKVGDREVRDVTGSVTNDADSLLLGQSFLTRFRTWSIDNQRGVLLLK